jgi:hypothetical protein
MQDLTFANLELPERLQIVILKPKAHLHAFPVKFNGKAGRWEKIM